MGGLDKVFMSYSAKSIANYFIQKSNFEIDLLKLMKLVYFSYGWSFVFLDNKVPLIDENIEAWQYGPVIPSIYHEFKGEKNPLRRYAKDYNSLEKRECEVEIPDKLEIIEFLNHMWKIYGKYTGWELSVFTHEAGAPWAQIVDEEKAKNGFLKKNVDIPDNVIAAYFKSLAEKMQSEHSE